MQNQTIAIIQARMSSQRLPGKVMMPLVNTPIIWHIYQRALSCQNVGEVMVATSKLSSDDPLADFCYSAGLNVFRGDLNNVMKRFLGIRNHYPASNFFVRICGDSPLIDPDFIDNQILALQKFSADCCWTENLNPVFAGQGVQSWSSLERIHRISSAEDDQEHVGSIYLSRHPDQFRIAEIRIPEILNSQRVRISIDEIQDYDLISALYEDLYVKGKIIPLKKALNWLTEHPEASKWNANVQESAANQEVRERFKAWLNTPKAGVWEYE